MQGKRACRSGRVRRGRQMLRRSEEPDRRIHASGGQFRAQLAMPSRWSGRGAGRKRNASPPKSARIAENMPALLLLAACRAAAGFARWAAQEARPACNNCAMRCSGWRGGAHVLRPRFNTAGWSRPVRRRATSSMRDDALPTCCAARARASGSVKPRRAVHWRGWQRPGARSGSAGAGCSGPRLRRSCAARNAKPP